MSKMIFNEDVVATVLIDGKDIYYTKLINGKLEHFKSELKDTSETVSILESNPKILKIENQLSLIGKKNVKATLYILSSKVIEAIHEGDSNQVSIFIGSTIYNVDNKFSEIQEFMNQ